MGWHDQLFRGAGSAGAPGAQDLPDAPSLAGYAFGELATDASSEARLERTLAAMGFAHIGQHLSKPVQLWQQGSARVLLNFGAENHTGVSALAVESADPARSVERARALLAPVLPHTRGQGEADLTAVEAPDASAVFFVRTSAGDVTSWLNDFILTDTGHTSQVGLTHIDHIALAQPFDHFDEAALYYRSVLGLDPHDDGELAAPFGLVRSRAVVDPDGRVRRRPAPARLGQLLRRSRSHAGA